MPPSYSQRPSKLDEYQKFQAGQAAQQAQMMQMLQQMYGISNQGTQQELARSELGMRQSELEMKQAAQPSEIATKLARAEYEKALTAGYPAEQASVIANRTALTAHTQAQTAGMQQQQGFAPQEFASTQAQRGAQTQLTTEQAKALGYENEFGQRNAAARAGILEGQLGIQPLEQQRLTLGNRGLEQDLIWNPILRGAQVAESGARTGATLSGMEGQDIQNANAPARNMMELMGMGANIARTNADTAGQLEQNDYIGPLAKSHINLGNAQIGSMTANDMLKLYSMGGSTLPQLQQGGFPEQYKTIFGPGYKAAEDQRQQKIIEDQTTQAKAGAQQKHPFLGVAPDPSFGIPSPGDRAFIGPPTEEQAHAFFSGSGLRNFLFPDEYTMKQRLKKRDAARQADDAAGWSRKY